MKHTKTPCRCASYKWPHRHDIKRCVYEDEPRQEWEDRADDPRRGQADAINRENSQGRQR